MEETDRFSLVSTGKATYGVLGLVQDTPVQERHGHTGKSPTKRHNGNLETEASVLPIKVERGDQIHTSPWLD